MPDTPISEPTEEQTRDNLFEMLIGYARGVPMAEQIVVEKIGHQQLKVRWRGAEFAVHIYKSGSIWQDAREIDGSGYTHGPMGETEIQVT